MRGQTRGIVTTAICAVTWATPCCALGRQVITGNQRRFVRKRLREALGRMNQDAITSLFAVDASDVLSASFIFTIAARGHA